MNNWNPDHPGDGYGTPHQGTPGGYGTPYQGASDGYVGYGPPPVEYGPPIPLQPHHGTPPQQAGSGSAITALVIACVQLVLCCGVFAIPGIVFGALALGEKYDAEKAARHTRTAWVFNWANIGFVLLAALFVLVVILSDM